VASRAPKEQCKAASPDRKTAEVRERELRLALSRIQRGRSRTKAKRLSIAAVACEAGVTAALIHNHYPDVAEAICEARGRGEPASREVQDQTRGVAELRQRSQRSGRPGIAATPEASETQSTSPPWTSAISRTTYGPSPTLHGLR